MISVTCALMLAIPSFILLLVVIVMPIYLTKQNQKAIDAIIANQELVRAQIESDRKREKDKKLFGLTLQAYERVALFLERINPVNIIPRLLQPGQKVSQLEQILVNSIREEYEHNMSQQLYISDNAWRLVKVSKEQIIKLINTSAKAVDRNAPAAALAKEVLTKGFDKEISSLDATLINLKKDLQNNI